ncbi:MAG: hypothetical protein JO307_12610 [Bryobacterales bacterium]|nr:hypothetical protein [Bryobacterales bacterium]MBV9399959.1 hypothetical protein [Bryobacterales bacterium]
MLLSVKVGQVANLRPIANRPARAKIVLASCFIVAALSSACRPQPNDPVLRYVQLAVALGERDPDSIDYYYGPEEWVADIRAHPPPPLAIKQAALELARKLHASKSPQRDWLIKQLNAIAARADLARGAHVSFEDQARMFFDLRIPPPESTPDLNQIRREIDRLLPGNGNLAARYSSFDRRFLVPPERLPAVMDRAMQGCREQTLRHLQLPPGESVSVEYVRNQPWNAYSFYQGKFHSLIRVNTDFPLTADRILELACHEGYPGHHAYNILVDAELVRREHRLEFTVQPTFSPQSLSSEALATYAPEIAFAKDERLQFERDVLFPLAGLPIKGAEVYLRVTRLIAELDPAQVEISRAYVEGKLEWSRAAAALEDQALMTETEPTLKYLNEFGSYMLTYTVGRSMVKRCFAKTESQHQWVLFQDLILGRRSIQQCAGGTP